MYSNALAKLLDWKSFHLRSGGTHNGRNLKHNRPTPRGKPQIKGQTQGKREKTQERGERKKTVLVGK